MAPKNESSLWWQKDLLMAKESAAKKISVANEGKVMSAEEIIKESKKLIEWFYGVSYPVNPFETEEMDVNQELDEAYNQKMGK